MSLYNDLKNDRRVIAWAVAIILALILILTPLPGLINLNHGVKYGLDLEGGSYLQLQLQGAIVQVNADPQKILEKQFGASSVNQNSNGYVLTVNGNVPTTLPDNLGYTGAKIVQRNNVSQITITETPESVIATYLGKSLGTDVKVVPGSSPVQYEIRTNTTRDAVNALLAPFGGSVAPGEASFVDGLTPDTVSLTKSILDAKLNRLGLKDIQVCTHYELHGEKRSEVPLDLAELAFAKPVYTTVPGWQEDTTGMTKFSSLPAKARQYLEYIAKDLGVTICVVSTGAKREETIMV